MADFTPGPWAVWEGGVVVHDDAIEGNVICLEPEHMMKASLASWPANARLIAAAPDMFTLIADIEQSLTADNSYRLLREACRTVLAKVRPETPSDTLGKKA